MLSVAALIGLGMEFGNSRQPTMDLGGEWSVAVNGAPHAVRLPGDLATQGIGAPVTVATEWTGNILDRSWFTSPRYAPYRKPGHVEVPFWLQPDRTFVGVADYSRSVTIPPSWVGKDVLLHLERAHWLTRLWVDGRSVGGRDSLSVPHDYSLGPLVAGAHTIRVEVDNRVAIDVGRDAHSISDQTQGNWNGIVGEISLRAAETARVDDLQAYPEPANRRVRVVGSVAGNARKVLLSVGGRSISADVHGQAFSAELALDPGTPLWDEYHPNLCRLTARVENGLDVTTGRFGLRDFKTKGTQFTINGRKIFLRGTLDCAAFPSTGYPPTDVASWKRVVRICKSYGLNLIRFHSWCPPQAAFEAADELGFFYQVELPCWCAPGDTPKVATWLTEETARILRAYGNHPSFAALVCGNEPGGDKVNTFLAQWVTRCKTLDSRHLYSSASGWPQLPENDFHVQPEPRIQQWGQGLESRINKHAPETVTDYRAIISAAHVPIVSHEIGQWCSYPDFREIESYTGAKKHKNYELFRDFLRSSGQLDLAAGYLRASGKLQTLCYKEEIESALRTPGMGGFELLGLQDFPGQGTATVGVLDARYQNKGYVSASAFRQFCNDIVPLARLPKRVFQVGEPITASCELAEYGEADVRGKATWRLLDPSGVAVRVGSVGPELHPAGQLTELGNVAIPTKGLPTPAKYTFELSVAPRTNTWDVWLYPEHRPSDSTPVGVTVCHKFDEAVLAKLRAGGRVALLADPGLFSSDVAFGFSTIFWNTAWTDRQPPTTLGIYCDPRHPLFANFPTEEYSNWQWWYVVQHARPMILDDMPKRLGIPLRVIDDWFQARRLGLVFEAKVERGSLLVCSIDLDHASDPVCAQLRSSLLHYVAGPEFAPRTSVDLAALQRLLLRQKVDSLKTIH